MKKIVHLSDLHFGKVDTKRIDPLKNIVTSLNPDMVVISGDLTQRAKDHEFIEAKQFIDDLNRPAFVVPGNHDIPLYNIFRRLFTPHKKYTEHICSDLSPCYIDNEIALIGINTTRNTTITSGRINKEQLRNIEEQIKDVSKHVLKIVVCHHPFDIPTKQTHHRHTHKVIGRSKMGMRHLAKLGVDIFLSGHLHLHHVGDTTSRYNIENYSGLLVHAGTAISVRSRGEPVSFNVLSIDNSCVTVEHYSGNHDTAEFILTSIHKYVKTKNGWRRDMEHAS